MKQRPDHYARKAKQDGYPARSAYKLQEIQSRYRVILPGMNVLDIGAAPGSWSMYALASVGKKGRVVAVDLKEVSPSVADPRLEFILGDAFGSDLSGRIASRAPFDAVLSDAAPSTTGSRTVDTARSCQLARSAYDLASRVLRAGGNLVVKVFQGGDELELLQRLRESFATVKTVRPEATKKSSFEMYIVALGLKASATDSGGAMR